jgi:hypothetical protein
MHRDVRENQVVQEITYTIRYYIECSGTNEEIYVMRISKVLTFVCPSSSSTKLLKFGYPPPASTRQLLLSARKEVSSFRILELVSLSSAADLVA